MLPAKGCYPWGVGAALPEHLRPRPPSRSPLSHNSEASLGRLPPPGAALPSTWIRVLVGGASPLTTEPG